MRANQFILFLFTLIGFISCKQEPQTDSKEMEALMEEIRTLRMQDTQKDSSFNEVLGYFNEIQENLNKIKEKENIVSMSSKAKNELSQNQKDQIINDIQAINTLLSENKKKIAELRGLLKNKGTEIAELEKIISNLDKTLELKDFEITTLREDLTKMKISYDLLSMENMEQQELIEAQEGELNTAFYCFGNFKELREKGVLTKEGGFIGIGSSAKLSDNMNQEYFTEIDITKTKEINLFVKSAELVTSHPKDSYELVESNKKIEKLVISNPQKFWSVSKYLVINTES